MIGLAAAAGCRNQDRHGFRPDLVRSLALADGDSILQPMRLQVLGDTLFVSYHGVPRLDLYTFDLNRLGSIFLTRPEPVMPSAFVVSDSQIVAADHTKGLIVIYNRRGEFIDSFGLLPDHQTRLSPLDLARFGETIYLTDMVLKQVLAISATDLAGVTDRGELIMQVPGDQGDELGFPSSVFVTPDGRLLVGDAGAGRIRVFTCDGREIYEFDPIPEHRKISPLGFAMDDLRDPAQQSSTSFDPSGVREQGRIHVVDGRSGSVHMFSSLGKFIASYPLQNRLAGPSDIAIAPAAERIFVADSGAKRIHIFRYGDG